jgi:hypothetical protein
VRAAAALVAALALATAGAAAAASGPTPHDRALARQLATQVGTFRKVASSTSDDLALKSCAYLETHPSQAFAAMIAVLPALLIDVVAAYKPQLLELHKTLARMRPDSPLFARWLAAELQSFDLLLQFDNGGRQIDLCKAAEVMTSKTATRAQVQGVLGIDPRVIAKLVSSVSKASNQTEATLSPKIRAFFVAAGLTAKQATALTK